MYDSIGTTTYCMIICMKSRLMSFSYDSVTEGCISVKCQLLTVNFVGFGCQPGFRLHTSRQSFEPSYTQIQALLVFFLSFALASQPFGNVYSPNQTCAAPCRGVVPSRSGLNKQSYQSFGCTLSKRVYQYTIKYSIFPGGSPADISTSSYQPFSHLEIFIQLNLKKRVPAEVRIMDIPLYRLCSFINIVQNAFDYYSV